jgi:hypothetical protein
MTLFSKHFLLQMTSLIIFAALGVNGNNFFLKGKRHVQKGK